MAHTRNGNYIGAAASANLREQRQWIASLSEKATPDYAAIIVATFGKEYARQLMTNTGFEFFKVVSRWLSMLTEDELALAKEYNAVGLDIEQIMYVIEGDAMTKQVKETQNSL